MTHSFQAALRELRLFPSRPVRLWAEGMVIELRVIQLKAGSAVAPAAAPPGARILQSNRWHGVSHDGAASTGTP